MTSTAIGKGAAHNLGQAKVRELAQELREQGYEVEIDAQVGNTQFDILAEKEGKTMAVEVKVLASDRALDGLAQRQHSAQNLNINEFRLVLVTPPHEIQIDVNDLDRRLYLFLSENHPAAFDAIKGLVHVEDVDNIDIDSLDAMSEGIRVIGRGTVYVTVEEGGGDSRDGVIGSADFPFGFDALLDHRLTIINDRSKADVDISDYYNMLEGDHQE